VEMGLSNATCRKKVLLNEQDRRGYRRSVDIQRLGRQAAPGMKHRKGLGPKETGASKGRADFNPDQSVKEEGDLEKESVTAVVRARKFNVAAHGEGEKFSKRGNVEGVGEWGEKKKGGRQNPPASTKLGDILSG